MQNRNNFYLLDFKCDEIIDGKIKRDSITGQQNAYGLNLEEAKNNLHNWLLTRYQKRNIGIYKNEEWFEKEIKIEPVIPEVTGMYKVRGQERFE